VRPSSRRCEGPPASAPSWSAQTSVQCPRESGTVADSSR
jgi:hypothetical protein